MLARAVLHCGAVLWCHQTLLVIGPPRGSPSVVWIGGGSVPICALRHQSALCQRGQYIALIHRRRSFQMEQNIIFSQEYDISC